jgi:hypothetical protein
MGTKTIYTYSIIAAQEAIVTDLETRSEARDELALVKRQGYPKAKIVQSVYQLQSQRQVR